MSLQGGNGSMSGGRLWQVVSVAALVLSITAVVLGLMSFAGYGSKTSVRDGPRQGYVIAITHGPKDPDRVMLALVTASKLPSGDHHVWFSIDGGPLCKKGEAEKVSSPLFTKQGNAARMIEELRAKGIGVHI